MDNKIYFRLKSRYWGELNQQILLKDIAQLISDESTEEFISELPICTLAKEDNVLKIIDAMQIVRIIQQKFPNADVQIVGPSQTVIYLKQTKKRIKPILFMSVWILLFIGAGLAVMNFHEDVSMREVHIKLHEVVTGEKLDHPLWLQVPYSIGLGLGMILFFNHLFRKRINEEPSPMELEMFNYEENIDRYVTVYENEAWKNKK